MERRRRRPPRLPLLVFVLVATTCPLGSSAGIGSFGVGAESNGASSSFRTRSLLQIGDRNEDGLFHLPHTRALTHKSRSHRKVPTPAPAPESAPAPSPSMSPPDSSPSPSPHGSHPMPRQSTSHRHPSITPPHLVRPGPRQDGNDPLVYTPAHSRHKHFWTTYGLVAAGIAVFLLVSAASILCFRAKKMGTVRPWATGLSGQLQKAFVTGVPSLKRSELETACEDFSNIIGSTSTCMLYKGTLSSGVEIAVASSLVTSAKDWSKENESQYRKKITNLSKVSHKNFMNLLGYCEEEHPFTRVMVFEYAPNGTLFEHLHVREAEKLDWMARLRISMGIAYCLEHMHQLQTPAALRNFDSTTVYLTDDFAAKVSDLEFWNDAKGHNSTTNNELAFSPDMEDIVRKYGMVLLEILTGRVPSSEDDGPLENWVSRYFEGGMRLEELIDPSIGFFPEDTARALCEVVRSCIDRDPKKRPQMKEVAARMREITALGPDGATPKVSPLWWAELEIMTSES
ncbi:putative leucine-rich repeat transmembrane protein kinase family protein isoform X3 [Zea mays]|uniref:Protein kinase domain-containing protein n=1 Tax=Zea mays TaxID=4577 RepID=B4FUJ4_MAIZE|nr:putative leucine-rich repeat transmembrane protein kinase family protein isoform X3 [Zea mays]ACF85787.1 unknown [Zea mays]|eukprot:XP_008667339.1 putative leucine-rich repeat transmembrane protein kinase family protein isoform X3 [Zea mays]